LAYDENVRPSMACANVGDHRPHHQMNSPPAKQQHAVWRDEFRDRSLGSDTSWSRSNP
jgi:hypothetical protein